MKIIHTSDLHLSSPLTSKLSTQKRARRIKELQRTFIGICEYASKQHADAVIIAGDLFDTQSPSLRDVEEVLSIISDLPEVDFLYVCGNHERRAVENSGHEIPKNLHLFTDDWGYFRKGGVTFAARSSLPENSSDGLTLNESDVNVVILHGDARISGHGEEIINLGDYSGKGIDYMALGHYHTYSVHDIDKRGIAVYSGTPEGRGFDETGRLGFVEIDTDGGLRHKFVPFSKRCVKIIPVDITDARGTSDIKSRVAEAISTESCDDIIRIALTGKREPEIRYDTDFIKSSFENKFFHFEIKDESKLVIDWEKYVHDKSLKGEFIRLCAEDETLTDRMRELIIRYGLSALANEIPDV